MLLQIHEVKHLAIGIKKHILVVAEIHDKAGRPAEIPAMSTDSFRHPRIIDIHDLVVVFSAHSAVLSAPIILTLLQSLLGFA